MSPSFIDYLLWTSYAFYHLKILQQTCGSAAISVPILQIRKCGTEKPSFLHLLALANSRPGILTQVVRLQRSQFNNHLLDSLEAPDILCVCMCVHVRVCVYVHMCVCACVNKFSCSSYKPMRGHYHHHYKDEATETQV